LRRFLPPAFGGVPFIEPVPLEARIQIQRLRLGNGNGGQSPIPQFLALFAGNWVIGDCPPFARMGELILKTDRLQSAARSCTAGRPAPVGTWNCPAGTGWLFTSKAKGRSTVNNWLDWAKADVSDTARHRQPACRNRTMCCFILIDVLSWRRMLMRDWRRGTLRV